MFGFTFVFSSPAGLSASLTATVRRCSPTCSGPGCLNGFSLAHLNAPRRMDSPSPRSRCWSSGSPPVTWLSAFYSTKHEINTSAGGFRAAGEDDASHKAARVFISLSGLLSLRRRTMRLPPGCLLLPKLRPAARARCVLLKSTWC